MLKNLLPLVLLIPCTVWATDTIPYKDLKFITGSGVQAYDDFPRNTNSNDDMKSNAEIIANKGTIKKGIINEIPENELPEDTRPTTTPSTATPSVEASPMSCVGYMRQKYELLEEPFEARFYYHQSKPALYTTMAFPENDPRKILELMQTVKGLVNVKKSTLNSNTSVSVIIWKPRHDTYTYNIKYGFTRVDFYKSGKDYYPAIIGVGHNITFQNNERLDDAKLNWPIFRVEVENKKMKGMYDLSSYGITTLYNIFNLNTTIRNLDPKNITELMSSMESSLKEAPAMLSTLSSEALAQIKLQPQYIAISPKPVPKECFEFEAF